MRLIGCTHIVGHRAHRPAVHVAASAARFLTPSRKTNPSRAPRQNNMQTQMRLTAQPVLAARGSRAQAPVCASSFMGSKLPAKGESVAELRGSVRRSCAPAAVEVRSAALWPWAGPLRAAGGAGRGLHTGACGSRRTRRPAAGAGPSGWLQIRRPAGHPCRRQCPPAGVVQGAARRLAVGRLLWRVKPAAGKHPPGLTRPAPLPGPGVRVPEGPARPHRQREEHEEDHGRHEAGGRRKSSPRAGRRPWRAPLLREPGEGPVCRQFSPGGRRRGGPPAGVRAARQVGTFPTLAGLLCSAARLLPRTAGAPASPSRLRHPSGLQPRCPPSPGAAPSRGA